MVRSRRTKRSRSPDTYGSFVRRTRCRIRDTFRVMPESEHPMIPHVQLVPYDPPNVPNPSRLVRLSNTTTTASLPLSPVPLSRHVSHPIHLATFNIVSGSTFRLKAALRALSDINIDIALLTETKITTDAYPHHYADYTIHATTAVSRHQGGVALCWRTNSSFLVEGISLFGPNVLSFHLVSGRRRWLIIGGYIPPSETDATTCHNILSHSTT
jgi:hypothetical protein